AGARAEGPGGLRAVHPARTPLGRPAAPGSREGEGRVAVSDAQVDATVFPLAVRRVTIDPGHGGGSLGTHTPRGLVEKDLTFDIADRLRKRLEKEGFQVVMTRSGDAAVALDRRGSIANRSSSDIFVSIHVNW